MRESEIEREREKEGERRGERVREIKGGGEVINDRVEQGEECSKDKQI